MIKTPHLFFATAFTAALTLSGCDTSTSPDHSTTKQTSANASSNLFIDEVTARPVIQHYSAMAFAIFSDALTEAEKLQAAVDNLIASPSEATLSAARNAWLSARIPYMQSEVFRFGNSIVDDWEGQLNAWPLDEGLIDYVAADYQYVMGNPGATANIIANTTLNIGDTTLDLSKLTPELLASLNELGGSEANVATGYHAIEFLLWGQDLNGTQPGAGNRPASDYMQGASCTNQPCDRRGEFLKAATQLLVKDLRDMVEHWKPNTNNYRATLDKEPAEQGLRKILFGMGSLSLGELAGERMKVALEANSTEDEQDCFSDNTHNANFYNAKAVQNVYLGEYRQMNGTLMTGPSLSSLIAAKDSQADTTLKNKLAATEQALQQIVDQANKGQHFDQLIAADNIEGHKLIQQSIDALIAQTSAIEAAAKVLGINNLNPDNADHSF